MATGSDISQGAASAANLLAQQTQQQAKNNDPDGIFELFTELFNQAASFLGKVTPIKISGLVSTGLDAHVKPEAAAPVPATKTIMPGSGGAPGGALMAGLSKVFNFKNLLNGLSAPTIEALASIGETAHNVSTGDLFTFHPLPTGSMGKSSGIDYERV